jgi:hypothetical protein
VPADDVILPRADQDKPADKAPGRQDAERA